MASDVALPGKRFHLEVGLRKPWAVFPAKSIAVLAAILLSGCAQTGDLLPSIDSRLTDDTTTSATGKSSASELQKATTYWGEEFSKKPNDLNAALSFARNLKAMGEKRKAVSVLQQASVLHSADPELNGEYGRLALELDQVKLAGKLLEAADDPTKPDWKVISARGTVLAKQGQYKEAIPFYERALTLAQNHPSLLNNLALAHAMSGDPKKAEELLRQASQTGSKSPKVNQNLALVLSLQGKYDEAKHVAAQDISPDNAQSNSNYVRSIVRLEPKAGPGGAAKPFATTVAKALEPAPAKTLAVADAPATNWDTKVAGQTEAGPAKREKVSLQMKPAAIDAGAVAPKWKTDVASAIPRSAPEPDASESGQAGMKGSTR